MRNMTHVRHNPKNKILCGCSLCRPQSTASRTVIAASLRSLFPRCLLPHRMLFASRMMRDVPVLRNDVAAWLGSDGRFSSSSGAQFSSSFGPSVSFAVMALVVDVLLWPRHIVSHCISHECTVAVSHGLHGCSFSF